MKTNYGKETIKLNYKNKITRLNILNELIKETQEKIDNDFINYYKTEYPKNIEALEKYLHANIEKIIALKYEDDYDGWCDTVLIEMTNNKKILFDISRNDNWEKNKEAIILEDIPNKKISNIISNIFEEFPYIKTKHIL
jgi:hypothetical protein